MYQEQNQHQKSNTLNDPANDIFLLTGLRIYTGEYKAQGPTLWGPRALDSPVQVRKPGSKKFIAWLKFQFFLHS